MLRRLNTRGVLTLLIERPEHAFTVTELAEMASLSRPTVSGILRDLVTNGWAVASDGDDAPARAGRPARHYVFHRHAAVCVGVDAGPHSVGVVVTNLANEILQSLRSEFTDLSDPEDAVAAIEQTIQSALEDVPAPVVGITVAVPGVVDPNGDLRQSVVVPRWVDASLPRALASTFPGAAITVGNDVKLATIAELHARQSESTRNLLYLSVGRRISTGLVMGGALQIGATGAAGELGASPVVKWSGAVEQAMHGESRPLRVVAAQAALGEPEAAGIMQKIAETIAEGLALLALAVDPEVVILAGPGSQAGDALMRPLQSALAEVASHPPRLERALVESEPSAMGAAQQSLEGFRNSDGFGRRGDSPTDYTDEELSDSVQKWDPYSTAVPPTQFI